MCGISGLVNLKNNKIDNIYPSLNVMNEILKHRGPDGQGVFVNKQENAGLAHRRLSIIDLSTNAKQPMSAVNNSTIAFNGEIYNYIELQKEYKTKWNFKSTSDTETILAGYANEGIDCVNKLRGMFAFSIWDQEKQRLFCARDRFGIKPFYYTVVDDVFYFASEAKALLPFVKEVIVDEDALSEYLTFQYCIGEKTLFQGIYQLPPAHQIIVENGHINVSRYWDVKYDIDHNHTQKYFEQKLEKLIDESIDLHLRSDVPISAYVSGGIDSSLIATLAKQKQETLGGIYHGRFSNPPGYDESHYAQMISQSIDEPLHMIDITANDFLENISNVIYHLDVPIAGPGSFPQYMVSKLASENVKVILGGQGGDEIFGGYARYIIAYFEQCIKGAIEGTYKNGNFVVTPESIIPNLGILREYKPLLKQFWQEGLFEPLDQRYFRLVNRSNDMKKEVKNMSFDKVFQDFQAIFNNQNNTKHESYFDKMTHFDFKCLLPALLHVEDRMSMAHGLESRVPFLDHPLIEFAATIPADIKFSGGRMKHLLKDIFGHLLPHDLVNRRDKMGFPTPLKEWYEGELKTFIHDMFSSQKAQSRSIFNSQEILNSVSGNQKFSRKLWGLMSLEIWYQQFHDQHHYYKNMLKSDQHIKKAA